MLILKSAQNPTGHELWQFTQSEALTDYQWIDNDTVHISFGRALQAFLHIDIKGKSFSVTQSTIKSKGHIVDPLQGIDNYVLFSRVEGDKKSQINQLYTVSVAQLLNNNFDEATPSICQI